MRTSWVLRCTEARWRRWSGRVPVAEAVCQAVRKRLVSCRAVLLRRRSSLRLLLHALVKERFSLPFLTFLLCQSHLPFFMHPSLPLHFRTVTAEDALNICDASRATGVLTLLLILRLGWRRAVGGVQIAAVLVMVLWMRWLLIPPALLWMTDAVCTVWLRWRWLDLRIWIRRQRAVLPSPFFWRRLDATWRQLTLH